MTGRRSGSTRRYRGRPDDGAGADHLHDVPARQAGRGGAPPHHRPRPLPRAVNGQQLSDDWFRPGWTDYSKRLQYQTYDITDLVQKGANAVGVVLGDGWWSGRVGWTDRGIVYGGAKPALLAQIEVTHDDGSVTTVGTDRRGSGAKVQSDDRTSSTARSTTPAMRSPVGRVSIATSPASGRAARSGPGPDVQIVATRNEPVKVVAEIMPIDEPTRTGGGAASGRCSTWARTSPASCV